MTLKRIESKGYDGWNSIKDIMFWLFVYLSDPERSEFTSPPKIWLKSFRPYRCPFESVWIFSNLSDGGEAKLHPEEPELFDWRLAPV